MSLAEANISSLQETIKQVKKEIKESPKIKIDVEDIEVRLICKDRKELTDFELIKSIDDIDAYILARVEKEEKSMLIKNIVISIIGIISLLTAVVSFVM